MGGKWQPFECLCLYQVDSLEKVLKDRIYFQDQQDTLHVAKGETASVQIVLKANNEMRGYLKTAWVAPAGDAYVVSPGYRKLYSSIRFEAMRDGIYDYELLKMIEKKDVKKAKELCNEIILNFDNYDGSISYFRKIRKELLERLAQE